MPHAPIMAEPMLIIDGRGGEVHGLSWARGGGIAGGEQACAIPYFTVHGSPTNAADPLGRSIGTHHSGSRPCDRNGALAPPGAAAT